MKMLIKNGRVLDPKNNFDAQADVFIQNGKVELVGDGSGIEEAEIIDAGGLWVTPGLIDMHVHLREPGQIHKETIESGTRAAAAGGFTTVCAMPNTSPVCHDADIVRFIVDTAAERSPIRVLPVGAITYMLAGEELTDMTALKEAGICAVSDDGKSVASAGLFFMAMQRANALGLPVLAHCEDLSLTGAGVMHAGAAAEKLELAGIPTESEDAVIARDIELARATGAHLHICHVSTAGGVELIRSAQNAGLPVTAEVTPHHIALTDEDVRDTNFKMAPPLRSRADRAALLAALKDGTIAAIATDHAPHADHEKPPHDFTAAANGIIGLETAVPVAITHLVETGILSPLDLIAKFTSNPAKVLNLNLGHLSPGAPADITIIDPSARHTIDKNTFRSLSRNTPFHGCELTGRVTHTIFNGKGVFQ